MQSLPMEMTLLGGSVLLLLAYLFTQSISGALEQGVAYKISQRDEARPARGPFAGRASRAFSNYLETYPAFVALVLALVVVGKTGGLGTIGAVVWLTMRVIYLPLYLFSTSLARSIVWFGSIFGLLAMLIRLFF